MDLSFLPNHFIDFININGTDKLYEIRIRNGFPIKINYDNVYYTSENKFNCTSQDIENIISTVTERSVYAFNEYIKNGFITTKNGLRIGLAGECVIDSGQVITIKKIQSLNIRIPHEIENCSKLIFPHVFLDEILNTLIISPPFCGKTTILKDLAIKLNRLDKYSILIVDERAEFENINGINIDKIKYGSKDFAFNYGIRSLSPDLIITDELSTVSDWNCIKNAIYSGVKVLASCHGKDINDIKNKNGFLNVFERYVILKNNGQAGEVDKILDKDFNEI